LDQIPDEELDRLAGYGFTGLWLIGLWERSIASERIKKMRGNPEAVASAYSLMNYSIAPDLGGEEAYRNLKDRCWRRGIRLASDMVPNHMGIDSDWVINHPDWFLQLDYQPFPGYNFTGEDLSNDERVGIYIEDGYWNNSDAAVVFKRLDKYTGSVRYIYHGNDGTSMPWNDTAQLNYLIPEVREAVIQTILHVARMFPIIRFDAAMTLAKKHYQRLWFPQPGTGGDIPSRAEQGLTRKQFDEAFPVEFWREVVDRIQEEVPDTLLLAEAFWMMEGYFVRSLGMHRVYNSAFMNMLKAEENEKYRLSIKNVLEFNPQILKRYVNFMNNPDEETAIAQFGTDDKYFGVCVMMSTLPGLPMFGHGQIEGYSEKYGMEYKKAYWDESINTELVQRHERDIFPLLRKRYLYSDVENFLLYDFYTSSGHVNENVFAYGNRVNDERSLIFYHNKFDKTSGWIHTSAAYLENNQLIQKTLGQGLNVDRRSDLFICFRNFITGLEYIRSSEEIWNKGLYIELEAFKYQIFVDFREVQHTAYRPYYDLSVHLNGGGVPSIEAAMDEFIYRPVLNSFYECINPGSLKWLAKGTDSKEVIESFNKKLEDLINTVCDFEKLKLLTNESIKDIKNHYITSLNLFSNKSGAITKIPKLNKSISDEIKKYFSEKTNKQLKGLRIILILPFLNGLKLIYSQDRTLAETFLESRLYDKKIEQTLRSLGADENLSNQEKRLVKILTFFENGLNIDNNNPALPYFEELFNTKSVQHFLCMNEFDGTIYFNKEQFATLMFWLTINKIIQLASNNTKGIAGSKVNAVFRDMNKYVKLADKCGYKGEDFLEKLDTL
jgi:glycosidase